MLNLENNQTLIPLDPQLDEKLEEALDVVASGEGVEYEPEVSLYFVDDPGIRDINLEFRDLDSPTDVLSFPALAYAPGRVFSESYSEAQLTDDLFLGDNLLLGDVVISLERAQRQAVEYGHSLEREILFLFVHSLLHLLGYDHMELTDRERMTDRERYYMTRIGVERS